MSRTEQRDGRIHGGLEDAAHRLSVLDGKCGQFAQAAELKDKIKTVLTDKATVETDEHANALGGVTVATVSTEEVAPASFESPL